MAHLQRALLFKKNDPNCWISNEWQRARVSAWQSFFRSTADPPPGHLPSPVYQTDFDRSWQSQIYKYDPDFIPSWAKLVWEKLNSSWRHRYIHSLPAVHLLLLRQTHTTPFTITVVIHPPRAVLPLPHPCAPACHLSRRALSRVHCLHKWLRVRWLAQSLGPASDDPGTVWGCQWCCDDVCDSAAVLRSKRLRGLSL